MFRPGLRIDVLSRFLVAAVALSASACGQEATSSGPQNHRSATHKTSTTRGTAAVPGTRTDCGDNDSTTTCHYDFDWTLSVEAFNNNDGDTSDPADRRGQMWFDVELNSDGHPDTEGATFMVCAMVNLGTGTLDDNDPNGNDVDLKRRAVDDTSEWTCESPKNRNDTYGDQDYETRVNYHFGCKQISLKEGEKKFLFDAVKFEMTDPFMEGDLESAYLDVVRGPNLDAGESGEPDFYKDDDVDFKSGTCDSGSTKIINAQNSNVVPAPSDGGEAACEDTQCWANYWLEHTSRQSFRNSTMSGRWPTGNWVTMSRSEDSPVSLEGSLVGFPQGTLVTISVPDSNSADGRLEKEWVIPEDTSTDSCVGETVEIGMDYSIPPSSSGADLTSRLDADTSDSSCAGNMSEGSRARLLADVRAAAEYSIYDPGDWMYRNQWDVSLDTTIPTIEGLEMEWVDGVLVVDAAGSDQTTMATYATVDYRQPEPGENTSGVKFDTPSMANGHSQFYEELPLENYDPGQELEFRFRLGDRAHNEEVTDWFVLEPQ